MSLRIVSLASFLFFAGFAAAGRVSAPKCGESWKASDNSLGQDPCTVAAYLLSTCTGDLNTIKPLGIGKVYIPDGNSQTGSGCMCNTVMYSLLSACEACQGGGWPTYREYTTKCVTVSTPGIFPHRVPSGTRVPKWALAPNDVNFDPATITTIGDTR